MSLRIAQDAHYKGKNWWRWSVWLDGPAAELDGISHVVYTLHPTFPTPVRRTDDRDSAFRISSAGWGEFEIYAEISLKNGEILKRRHWLKLEHLSQTPDRAVFKTTSSGGDASRRAPRRGATPKTDAPALTVFLSGSIGDVPAIRTLKTVLERHGATVTTAESMPANLPWEHAIRDRIRNADVAVFVLSRRPSLFLTEEIDLALETGTALVMPVLIGPDVEPPPQLQDWEAFRIIDETEIEQVAAKVLKSSLAKDRGL
jgi:transcription initiation factor IIF auxiliary subunit